MQVSHPSMMMNPEVHISGDTLTVFWQSIPGSAGYSMMVERCDDGGADDDCEQVFHRLISDTGDQLLRVEETSTAFEPCADYNLILEALSLPSASSSSSSSSSPSSGEVLLKETARLRKPPRECEQDAQVGLVVALCVLGALVALCAAALVYYHRRRPINRIQRVRSKVYSRLYSRDRYERPIPKRDFIRRAGELLEKEDEEKQGADGGRGGDGGFSDGVGGRRAMAPMTPLRVEYEDLERLSFDTIQRRTTAASTAVNRARNRYTDIVPYDANRVRLREPLALEGASEASDYVNASTVGDVGSSTHHGGGDGAQKKTLLGVGAGGSFSRTPPIRYIAAQGPGEETSPLFWEMIWQQDVRVVVMLTNLVEGFGFGTVKCCQYWPATVGEVKRFRDLEVQLYDVQEAPDYTVRKLDVHRRGTGRRSGGSGGSAGAGAGVGVGVGVGLDDSGDREIIHVQYKAWRDRSAPSDPAALLQLIDVVRSLAARYNADACAPWLVHCSAGVGRTGTFISVEQLTRLSDDRGRDEVDVFNHVYGLRRERRHMVQTAEQYVYVYRCLRSHLERRDAEEAEERRQRAADMA